MTVAVLKLCCVFPHSGDEVCMTATSGVIVAVLKQWCVFFLIQPSGEVYVRSDCCGVETVLCFSSFSLQVKCM